MNDTIPQGIEILTDVNVIAIGLTDDHPAYEDVRPWLTEALDGPNVLLVPDYYPLRAHYIMTNDFGVAEVPARNAIQSLIRSPARIVGATDAVLLAAYEISAEKQHDVYDSFILAMAKAYEATYIVTTDRDFDVLCEGEYVTYRNPVPEDKLDALSTVDG
jgi:predicted nucleic acid-binding protein